MERVEAVKATAAEAATAARVVDTPQVGQVCFEKGSTNEALMHSNKEKDAYAAECFAQCRNSTCSNWYHALK